MEEVNQSIAIERIGAVGQVIAYIKQMIRSGKYNIGDKLPNEAELAKTIGVGRSSLREGMRILAAYGLVEIRQGEGSFVIDKTAEQFFEFLGYIPSANFQNFVELRRVVEIGGVVSVYNKLTQDDFAELQSLIDQLDSKNGLETCVWSDREFHRKLLTNNGNPLLIQIDKMIYRMRSELLYKIMRYDDVVHAAHVAHQNILDALKTQDLMLCLKAVSTHLNEVTEYINQLGI